MISTRTIDAGNAIEEIRFQAEIMAKGTAQTRNSAYSAARREIEQLEKLNNDKADWNTGLVRDLLARLKERLVDLAKLDSTQGAMLLHNWSLAQTAMDNVADAIGVGKSRR